ncbi:MAG TPA: FtsX-like permease family protein [Candidatus Thermoplasmatota archaeon]|nr:FtsX-like permease family protein [Candidatus Thermoplasmatota archaeon]
MFGRVADDRSSLLLATGLALAAAYLAGGAAVSAGFADALAGQSDRFDVPAVLAWVGEDPFASPGFGAVPEGASAVRVAAARTTDGRPVTLAAVEAVGPGAPLEAGTTGIGPAADLAVARFEGNVTVRGVLEAIHAPRGWVFAPLEDFERVAPRFGRALVLAPGAEAPEGASTVPLVGVRAFVAGGGGALAAGFGLLVAATGLVAAAVTVNLAASAVEHHRADVHLARSLGASRADVLRWAASWLARIVGAGIVVGAALGVVLAYAAFSFGNRLGLRAPVTPAPDWTLAPALLALAALAFGAGLLAARRALVKLEGSRLEASP